MKDAVWRAAVVAAVLLAACEAAPFFPDEGAGADAEGRTHGLLIRKKVKKAQLLCSLLGGGGGGRGRTARAADGRTFGLLSQLLDYGGGGGGGDYGAPSSPGLCGAFQGGGGGGGGGGYPSFPQSPVSLGPVSFPGALGSLPGSGGAGLLSEGQEILSSLGGLVGAVAQAGSGTVAGLLGVGPPQRYLRPYYRAARQFFRLI